MRANNLLLKFKFYMLTFFEKEVNGYLFVFPTVSCAQDLVARFMTCDTGYIIFPALTLGCILWPLIFPPPAAYPGRSHASREDGKRCVTSAQVTAPNATCSARRSDGGVWSKVRERVAVPCSSLFARCPQY